MHVEYTTYNRGLRDNKQIVQCLFDFNPASDRKTLDLSQLRNNSRLLAGNRTECKCKYQRTTQSIRASDGMQNATSMKQDFLKCFIVKNE